MVICVCAEGGAGYGRQPGRDPPACGGHQRVAAGTIGQDGAGRRTWGLAILP